jgi:hypothetical protein
MAEIVNTEEDKPLADAQQSQESARKELVAWVLGKIQPWESFRESNYDERWEEYYRLWRGIWAKKDSGRQSERSRLIAPALQSAVESVTSEIESAVLDRAALFDIVDDPKDVEAKQDKDMKSLRMNLREDMNEAQFSHQLNQIFLNGSIYGTGIGKLDVTDVEIASIVQGEAGPVLSTDFKTRVTLTAILPQQFIIDTAAKDLDSGLGAAHKFTSPLHVIKEQQKAGIYLDGDIGQEAPDDAIESDTMPDSSADNVNVIDYRGKVPLKLLRAVERENENPDDEFEDLFPDNDSDDDAEDLVEAFVLIGNGGTLLKAKENLTLLKQRLWLAYRHEVVPDQFWGRGVCEKGYNSQKALDGSLRARMDGLALTVHPMMGVDASRMPRGFRFTVSPGRTIQTNGNPDEILRPVRFGTVDPNIFTDNAELERMVTMSTGGMDTSAPTKVNNRNETASGMSMQLGSFVKRSKRTIRNIETEFIVPMVKTTSNLYMQFDPVRYPANDVTFRAISVLGSMARELEQQQFTQMLQTATPDTPAYWLIMRSVYESSDLKNREQLIEFIDIKLEETMNPPPPPPDPFLEIKRMEAIAKVKAEHARIQVEYIRAQAEIARAANDASKSESEEAKNVTQALLNLAKAEAEEIGSQKEELNRWLVELQAASRVDETGLADEAIRKAVSEGAGINLGGDSPAGVPVPA